MISEILNEIINRIFAGISRSSMRRDYKVFKKGIVLNAIFAFLRVGVHTHEIPELVCELGFTAFAGVMLEDNEMFGHKIKVMMSIQIKTIVRYLYTC